MIISIANQKGGIAKTTTAINLAAGLAQIGYRVLLIDNDPQANVTQVFLHPQLEIGLDQSLYAVLVHFSSLKPIIHQTDFTNLSFVPSHIRLSGIDLELAQAFDNRSARLRRAMEEVRQQYDYIIIDNPPSLGLLTINAFAASDALIVPVSTAYFALTGLVQLQESIAMVQQNDLSKNLNIMGVLCTFADKTVVSRDVEEKLRAYFGQQVFETVIPKNVRLEEAHSNHLPIFQHAPQSSGAEAYRRLVQEVIQR